MWIICDSVFNKENNNNFIVRHQVVTKGTFVLQVSYHSEVISYKQSQNGEKI